MYAVSVVVSVVDYGWCRVGAVGDGLLVDCWWIVVGGCWWCRSLMSVVECGGGLSLVDCQGCRMVSVLASALVAGVGGGGVDDVGSGEGGCCSSFGGEVGDSDDGTGFGVDGFGVRW